MNDMSNKNQTAVEWLLNNLHEIGVNHNLSIKAEKGWLEKRNEIIKQAKAMEKEQIMKAYGQGIADEAGEILDATKDAQQYYNETYKSE